MLALSVAAAAVLLVFLTLWSRHNPLFLAGGAVFFALGRSAFIDMTPDQVLRQMSSLSVTTGDVVFLLLVLGWFYARRRRRAARLRLSPKWAILGLCVLFFLTLEYALTAAGGAGIHITQALVTRDWFYIPVGYLLALDLFRRFTAEEIQEYVTVLSLLCTCLMVLYIAAALNLPVYPYPKYLTTSFGGSTIVRDFTTLPVWAGLAWCYFLAKPHKSWWTFVALAVLSCGALLSYTRSLVLALVFTAVLATVLMAIRRGQRDQAVTIAIAGSLLAFIVIVGGSIAAPAQFGYFQDRLSSVSTVQGALNTPNAVLRQHLFRQAARAGEAVDTLFGAGLFDASPNGDATQYRSYDSDWIRIVYRTGPLGVVVFAAPLGLALWWGLRELLRRGRQRPTDPLLMTGVLVTVLSVILRFTGLTYFWWPALALFPLALIACATGTRVPAAASVAPASVASPSAAPASVASPSAAPASAAPASVASPQRTAGELATGTEAP